QKRKQQQSDALNIEKNLNFLEAFTVKTLVNKMENLKSGIKIGTSVLSPSNFYTRSKFKLKEKGDDGSLNESLGNQTSRQVTHPETSNMPRTMIRATHWVTPQSLRESSSP
ncbi:hypothetical protein HAX54_052567, partial [Datura stramonium]|nr:hypothetical protein [Datura stramonium]